VDEHSCLECERLVAAYRDCIFEAHDLRNQSLVLEASNALHRVMNSQRIEEVEGRAAELKRQLAEHKNHHTDL